MTRATFDTWINRLVITSLNGDQFTIAVPSQHAWEWLTYRLKALFERTLSRLAKRDVTVQFEVIE